MQQSDARKMRKVVKARRLRAQWQSECKNPDGAPWRLTSKPKVLFGTVLRQDKRVWHESRKFQPAKA